MVQQAESTDGLEVLLQRLKHGSLLHESEEEFTGANEAERKPVFTVPKLAQKPRPRVEEEQESLVEVTDTTAATSKSRKGRKPSPTRKRGRSESEGVVEAKKPRQHMAP